MGKRKELQNHGSSGLSSRRFKKKVLWHTRITTVLSGQKHEVVPLEMAAAVALSGRTRRWRCADSSCPCCCHGVKAGRDDVLD